MGPAALRLERGEPRHDVLAQRPNKRGWIVARRHHVDLDNADVSEGLHLLNEGSAARCRIGWRHARDRLAQAVVGGAFVLAVLAQDLQLLDRPGCICWIAEEVAGIGVLRHEPKSLLLTSPADHDRRRADRLRTIQSAAELIVRAVVRTLVVAPHLAHDLESLLQAFEPLLRRRERHAESDRLLLVPSSADPQYRAATGKHV